MCNLDNQIITGYDDKGFFAAQPWAPHVNFPPAALSFGSWEEFGDRFHVNFYVLRKLEPSERRTAVLDSLDYAVDLHRNSAAHSLKDYGVGPEAYATDERQQRWLAEGGDLSDLLSWSNHPNRAGHELVARELLRWFPIA